MKPKPIPTLEKPDYKGVVDHCIATGKTWLAPVDLNVAVARAALWRFGFSVYAERDESGILIGYLICPTRP